MPQKNGHRSWDEKSANRSRCHRTNAYETLPSDKRLQNTAVGQTLTKHCRRTNAYKTLPSDKRLRNTAIGQTLTKHCHRTNAYKTLPSDKRLRNTVIRICRLRPPISLLTQSCDQISCCRKPVERTIKIGLEICSLVRSTA